MVDEDEERPRPSAVFHFPDDFKWGVATAAHQVEGDNIHNDWWRWEQANGHVEKGHVSGQACDWWENAEADFDRAAAMGLNAMRLSVEWSRIEPQPGVFDESALTRYAEMLQGLRARGIEPMVTLHHFTNPLWMIERGGWEMPEAIDLFTRYVRRTVGALGQYCDMWCTINEPNVYGYMGYLEGAFPPGKADLGVGFRVIRHLLRAHAAAYREIHAIQPDAKVGLAHNMRPFDPFNPRSPLDHLVTGLTDRVYNQAILTALTKGLWMLPLGFGLAWRLRKTLDWIGLNYYTRDLIAFDHSQSQALFCHRRHADSAEMLDGEYGEFYPEGLFRCLQRLSRLGLPIYVTENGLPDDDDDQRPRYLLTHLHQMWHAIQLCYPVMGYYHWTLVDNFEWAEGWTLRFGLIELDPATQARTPRRSARLYAETVGANAIRPDVIDAYAPELRSVLLPG
ncbi:MAG TPA: glycoside hydrolase family 1 protein [Chloroflexi bacterium]|nr:glycoside hydrolase family 1 protein [Chloroflexota bacterium]